MKKRMNIPLTLSIALLLNAFLPLLVRAGDITPNTKPQEPTEVTYNKLKEMYAFFYLPFHIDFKVGEDENDIYPTLQDKLTGSDTLIAPAEMKKIEKVWGPIRENYKKNSLFLSTKVDIGKSTRISTHMVSHKISVNRTLMDQLPLAHRLDLRQKLNGKPAAVQANAKQLSFLKSLLQESDKGRFNFFIFAPSWCASSAEYRILFEAYFKKFPRQDLVLHTVVIDDPDELVFEAPLLKELFPHAKKSGHEQEIVPRFLALTENQGSTIVYEEGEALALLYQHFFKEHQGFLDDKIKWLIPESSSPRELSAQPHTSYPTP